MTKSGSNGEKDPGFKTEFRDWGSVNKMEQAVLMADPEKKSLKYTLLNNCDLLINLPKTAPDNLYTVIKLSYSGLLKTDSVRLLSTRQPNQLLVSDATLHGEGFSQGDPTKRLFNPSESITVGQIKLGTGIHQLKLSPGEYQGVQLIQPLLLTLNPAGN
ncbi:MAG: hypothetical protein Q8907_10720 [Bacteroidota bacterium]|nr:hypothetical protein [Bacteroidota bacterium]